MNDQVGHSMRRTRVFEAVSAVFAIILGLTLLSTAVLKILDINGFVDSIETWSMVPKALRFPVVVLVPAVELVVGLSILAMPSSRFAVIAGVAFVVAISAVYIVQYYWFGEPKCGCLGLVAKYVRNSEGAKWVLLRNAILVVIGILSVAIVRLTQLDADKVRQRFQ